MKRFLATLVFGLLLSSCAKDTKFELMHSGWHVKEGTSITYACLRFANIWSNICQDENRNIRKGNYRVLAVTEGHFLVFRNGKLTSKEYSRKAVNEILGIGAVAQTTNTGSTDISFTIKDKKEQCAAIGFKPQTEKFADCVLRLVELDVKQQYRNQIAVAKSSGNSQVAKQLEIQNNLQQSQFLMNLSQQLLTPSAPASLSTTSSCRVTGGTIKRITCW